MELTQCDRRNSSHLILVKNKKFRLQNKIVPVLLLSGGKYIKEESSFDVYF